MGPPTWLLVGVRANSRIWISRSRSLSKSAHSEVEWRSQASGVFRAGQLQHKLYPPAN
jgi:hypothetical protein